MAGINFIFYTDFAVFSVFVVLIITEIMGSVLLLLAYDSYKTPVLDYIVPVWEVTGTFGAFWVVVSDIAYPSLLVPVAAIFSFPIMLFLILFVARNSTISFAEFITRRGWLDERKLFKGYALASILVGIVVLVVVTSIFGGIGVDLGASTFSLAAWFSHPEGIIFIVGAVLIMIGLAPVFYRDPGLKRQSLFFTAAGVILSGISYEIFTGWHLSPFFFAPAVLAIMLPVLYYFPSTSIIVGNKAVFIALASVDVFLLNFMAYPTIFGGAISIDSVTTSGPLASSFFPITAAGATLLGFLIFLYALAVYRKGRKPGKPAGKVARTAGRK